jgi:hypothetical protein
MEKIQYLISFFMKFAFVLVLFAFIIWVLGIFYPTLSFRSLFPTPTSKSSAENDWLPDPTKWKGLFGSQNNGGMNGKVFVPGPAYNGYSNTSNDNWDSQTDYITYTQEGTRIIRSNSGTVDINMKFPVASSNVYADKTLYIRNLSIYEGGHIYTGLSFIGEARSTMFKNGKFPIIITDNTGKVVSVTNAEAMTNWAVPGWTRFQTKITSVLPNKISCTMIFQSSASYTTQQPTRVAIPILCN